jgi:hypothetical protein
VDEAYEPQPGDTCWQEGEFIIHDERCPKYPNGAMVDRKGHHVADKWPRRA